MASSAPEHAFDVARNWRLLEFAVVFFIAVLCLWLITPGISDSVKMTHETAVKQSGIALRESLKFLHLQQIVSGERNPTSYETIRALQKRGALLNQADCQTLWLTLLGEAAPSALAFGKTTFRVSLVNDKDQHLGCHFGYTLAGNMFIDYFPMSDAVIVDDEF